MPRSGPPQHLSNNLYQALHFVILTSGLAWVSYVLIKLASPLMGPPENARKTNWKFVLQFGFFLLSLVILDQFLLGRLR